MPTTPNRQYPYPALSAANDPPRDLQLLADALDADVAMLNDPQPVAGVYKAGWGPYQGGIDFLGVTATRSAGGLIGLSGMFQRTGSNIASTTAVQDVFELPAGYRPARKILTVVKGFAGGAWTDCRLDIAPNGLVQASWLVAGPWNGTGTLSWVSISGISFVAAP